MSRARPLDDRRVFIAARRVPRDRRDAFVARVCRENAELRARVEQLLAAAEQPSVFIRPPTGVRGFVADGPGATSKSARAKRHPPLEAGTRIAERYRVESTIGEGSSGRVYRGTDEILKTTIAIKVLDLEAGAELEQLRREAATLRWLRVPGVVNLQDDGVDAGRPYIVTDLVEGAPFPGAAPDTASGRRRWEDIRETAVGVLETLARIHAQGVIHGDLKPANVLVDAKGIPTVLDVGIASGPSIDFGESETLFAGTPSYMAPERIAGGPATVATDLYAVGVMLHRALLGEVPHQAETRTRLFDRRTQEAAEPIRARAPEVPADAARMIDALLARDPKDRPASAYDALDFLEHLRYVRPGNPDYPWLGSRELIDKLVQAAKDGRSMDIWGPPGSGKTRTLREAAKEISSGGRRVVWVDHSPLDPGGAPAPSHSQSTMIRARSLRTPLNVLAGLASGTVLIIDDIDRLAPEERDRVARGRPAGCVLAASTDSAMLTAPQSVPTIDRIELQRVFAGPDRLHHLSEDAAHEVHRRTGGRPGGVIQEVSRWIRSGLATWRQDKVHVTRHALERISADMLGGPWRLRVEHATEGAHGAVPGTGVPDSIAFVASLRSLVPELPTGADVGEIALSAAASLRDQGRTLLASAIVETGLTLAIDASAIRSANALLIESLRGAMREGTARALDVAVRNAVVASTRGVDADDVRAIAIAGIAAIQGRPRQALAILDAGADEYAEALMPHAFSVRILAARHLSSAAEAEAISKAATWANSANRNDIEPMLLGWLGWLRYRQGRFDDAADLHTRAARLTSSGDLSSAGRLSHAAQALIERGRFTEARALATEAAELGRRHRLPYIEARGLSMARIAAYRANVPIPDDWELLSEVRDLGVHHLTGELHLAEGARLWRLGRLDQSTLMLTVADASFERSAAEEARALARSLLDLIAKRRSGAQPSAWPTTDGYPPAVAMQVLALRLATIDGDDQESTVAFARRATETSAEERSIRREVLSLDEACTLVAASRARDLTQLADKRRPEPRDTRNAEISPFPPSLEV